MEFGPVRENDLGDEDTQFPVRKNRFTAKIAKTAKVR
jgi:hypothetical protein